jgi:ArsR family transcriptional regulator
MGTTKSELREQEDVQLSQWAALLSNPARLAILRHLLKQDSCINADLVEVLGLAQPTVTQHMKALKEAGLVQGQILGDRRNYCLNKAGLQAMQAEFESFFNALESWNQASCEC